MIKKNKQKEKISVIIPSYNEVKTAGKVINEVLKLDEVSELIFVNDGSTDNTKELFSNYESDKRFIYLAHQKNRGKGEALKTGLKKAKNDVVLFLDADLQNITSGKIKKIILPVMTDQVDLSRASFVRKRGRVTEYAVKPMMRILFPDVYFEQPISGQICGKKNFFEKINFESKYGVDIGILFDAIDMGQRILEVNIGKLEHKANSEQNIVEMSGQVLETMIKKAGLIQHKYKIVVFMLDSTLVSKKEIIKVFQKIKQYKNYCDLKNQYDDKEISHKEFVKSVARLFKGFDLEEMTKICDKISLAKYAKETILALKNRRFKVGIISTSLSPIVVPIANYLGVDIIDCVYVEKDEKSFYNGKISKSSGIRWLNEDPGESFKRAYLGILRKQKIKASEAIMVASTLETVPLIETTGLGIAFRPTTKELKEKAEKTISVLAELLAIVE